MNYILILIYFHTPPNTKTAVSHGWYQTEDACEHDKKEMLYVHGIQDAYCVVVR